MTGPRVLRLGGDDPDIGAAVGRAYEQDAHPAARAVGWALGQLAGAILRVGVVLVIAGALWAGVWVAVRAATLVRGLL